MQPGFQWSYPEFEHHSRGSGWYVWFGITAAVLIGIALFTANYLFAVIIILFALILFLNNWRKPQKLAFKITPEGLEVENKKILMREISEFWIVYAPPHVEKVYFQFHSYWRPVLGIPLAGQNPLDLREYLLQYLPENLDKEDEPMSDSIARMLKL